MIPVATISAHQQGQTTDLSLPNIKLGASLARVSLPNKSLYEAGASRNPRKSSLARLNAVRRVSEIIDQLPKVPESKVLRMEKTHQTEGINTKKKLCPKSPRRSTLYNSATHKQVC